MVQCLVTQNNSHFNICDCFTGDACILSDNDNTFPAEEKEKAEIAFMDKEKLLAKLATSSMTSLKPI
jgi:hypothetical protein